MAQQLGEFERAVQERRKTEPEGRQAPQTSGPKALAREFDNQFQRSQQSEQQDPSDAIRKLDSKICGELPRVSLPEPENALHSAKTADDVAIFYLAISLQDSNYARYARAEDSKELTPVDRAILANRFDVADAILAPLAPGEVTENIERPRSDGATSLHIAVQYGATADGVQLLLDKFKEPQQKIDLINKCNYFGESALDIAQKNVDKTHPSNNKSSSSSEMISQLDNYHKANKILGLIKEALAQRA